MTADRDDARLDRAFFQRNGDRIANRHFDRIIEKAREIEDKVRNAPPLHEVVKETVLCLELIRDHRSGEYREIPAWAIAAVAFGLLYLINPVELIPDVVPVVGYLDDVVVMGLILKLVKAELDKYENWRRSRSDSTASVPKPIDHA